MKEYIERAALKRELAPYEENDFSQQMDVILAIVGSQPAADVVEVVRCKDCQYWQDNNGGYPHPECRWGDDETPDADDYCSFGERMDKEDADEQL